ncbi:nucleotide-diphospho-sugar transferase [Spirosoma sp. KNUC1025]|uniref:nucleotide-diphospho-sugar transferase n=1 Tax=Spirosoma sp. KNUC1025 TaxID=2894082 RepID=UPI003869DDA4|nr:nucleotide-diphospho-sugar transferase [Spirosoma sp. KNUC1025]
MRYDIPILLIMFNRPEMALQVFSRIRLARPKTLYLTVDGPRLDRATDEKDVLACQSIERYVDWPCTVKTLYRTENLGCKRAVSSAITWFFEQVEMGIILEDDCLPDLTFFDYCQVLLNKYALDPKIMHVGGANIYENHKWGSDSYFFSTIPHIWGWATWRRAWLVYDVTMKDYPLFKRSKYIKEIVTGLPSLSYWLKIFDETYLGNIDTWDYQWVFAIWKNEGISIIPNQNLITNIGFGELATHTLSESGFANLPTVPMEIKDIKHPLEVSLNKEAINFAFTKFFSSTSWWGKFKSIRYMLS